MSQASSLPVPLRTYNTNHPYESPDRPSFPSTSRNGDGQTNDSAAALAEIADQTRIPAETNTDTTSIGTQEASRADPTTTAEITQACNSSCVESCFKRTDVYDSEIVVIGVLGTVGVAACCCAAGCDNA
ncbi:uncharacterized protein L201_006673 [Kwoniella dendrophila CBS 6074]|uniref:Uncharacterized protein n=1 Tax=Kwoniella dendrophila CBS 6074 TaxID=1295534 RepID=A0AAX4K1W5_9TREE